MKPHLDFDFDEDDEDYVPPTGDADGSDSGSDSDEPESKRTRTASPVVDEQEEAEKRERAAAIYASFQASTDTQPAPNATLKPMATVKVIKRYIFAGKEITEIVEVSEDSPDAKKWPRVTDLPPADGVPSIKQQADSMPPEKATLTSDPPPRKPPPKRKARTILPSLPSASSNKPQKLTTLAKSAMDWKAHTGGSQHEDELAANRRQGGGGYLENMDFLERVEEKRESVFEDSKSNTKRKR